MFTLKITVNQAGEMTVDGPMEQKILCLGILEAAKQVILNYNPSAIVVAKPIV